MKKLLYAPAVFGLIFFCLPLLAQIEQKSLPNWKLQERRSRSYDVHHIKLTVNVDVEQKLLDGIAEITLKPLNGNFSTVVLDAKELDIRSVSLAGDVTPTLLKFVNESPKLTIQLDKTYPYDHVLTLVIEYRVANPHRGLFFIQPDKNYPNKPFQAWTQGEDEENSYWFPCYDYPNDKSTSEMIITVKKPFLALSNGKLIETTENKSENSRTFHWLQNKPHVSYLVMMAIGDYNILSGGDFKGKPIQYYVYPSNAINGKETYKRTPDMIKTYSDKIGYDYVWDKYAQVEVADFVWGGMENTSATTMYDGITFDPKAGLTFTSDDLIAHELAHQWWGDLTTCKDWSHIWLNEGFATFMEGVYFESAFGQEEADYHYYKDYNDYMEEDTSKYRRPIVFDRYDYPFDLFDTHTYQKGGLTLRMLRHVLGDEAFWRGMNYYINAFAFKSVETNDFKNALEESSGQNLGWFFDQWLYKAGYPEFGVHYHYDDGKKELKLVVKQNQRVNEITPLFKMPVDIEITDVKGKHIHRVWVSKQEDVFYLSCESKPLMVCFDKGNWIIKTVHFSKPAQEWIYQLKNDGDISERMLAAKNLRILQIKNDEYVANRVFINEKAKRNQMLVSSDIIKVLIEAFEVEPFWGVRSEIAKILGETRTSAARDALLKGYSTEKNAKVRLSIAEAMGNFEKDETVFRFLKNAVEKEEAPYVVAEALNSLGRSKNSKAFEFMTKNLNRASHQSIIQQKIMEGLGSFVNVNSLKILTEYSAIGKESGVRQSAIKSLKFFEKNQVVEDYLIGLLDDFDNGVKEQALVSLERLKSKKALNKMASIAETDYEPRLRRVAADCIKKINGD
ncbi:M1 family metallopeptidase [bacterium]|nr:M1 family metallopeptidase [bacterium]